MERIDALAQEHRDLMNFGFKVHYAERDPKQLEAEQRRYFAKLYRGEPQDRRSGGMPMDVLLRFPGFRDYKKPVS